jgi:hypothetical protein
MHERPPFIIEKLRRKTATYKAASLLGKISLAFRGERPSPQDRSDLKWHDIGAGGRSIEHAKAALRYTDRLNRTPTARLAGRWLTARDFDTSELVDGIYKSNGTLPIELSDQARAALEGLGLPADSYELKDVSLLHRQKRHRLVTREVPDGFEPFEPSELWSFLITDGMEESVEVPFEAATIAALPPAHGTAIETLAFQLRRACAEEYMYYKPERID